MSASLAPWEPQPVAHRIPHLDEYGQVDTRTWTVDYRPIHLTRRGRLTRDITVAVLLTAFVVSCWLLGQHKQTRWCHTHPSQATVVAACQSGAHR